MNLSFRLAAARALPLALVLLLAAPLAAEPPIDDPFGAPIPRPILKIEAKHRAASRTIVPTEDAGKPEEKTLATKSGRAEPGSSKLADEPAADEVHDPDLLRLQLLDGSIVSGKLRLKEIQLDTGFGQLTIPVGSIRSLTPGLESHPAQRAKIKRLIERLAAAEADQREVTIDALLKFGPGVHEEVDRVVQAGGDALRTKMHDGLEELEARFDDMEPAEDDAPPAAMLTDGDAVETATFTAVGKMTPRQFVLDSAYGALSVSVADLRRAVRDLPEQPEQRKSLKVAGASLVQHGFINSGIHIERGDKISVTAGGTITMAAGGDQKMTPDGEPNIQWYIDQKIPSGALVAKIGTRGEIFKIGSRHSFVADRAGVLQFAIAVNDQFVDSDFPGEYNVRVRFKRK